MPYIGRDQDYEEPLASISAIGADLYALTMAQTLFLEGRHNQTATFHAFVRKTPHNAAYLLTAGQNIVSEWLDKHWTFTPRDMRRLAKMTVADPKTGAQVPLFKPEFLEVLKNAKLELSVDMMPEGEIAFAGEPIYKVSGPIWQGLMVEAIMLNVMNAQSNVATYASICKTAAKGKALAEFGLRRAHDIGGLASSRAAFIGGSDFTSNCWAHTNYGLPAIGTMAHAYVMVHETEMDAYRSWAQHNPHLGIFLPDTYEPVAGMKKAIQACRETGTVLQGFRQDSGDLSYLAAKGHEMAAEAGYDLKKNAVGGGLKASTVASLEEQTDTIDLHAMGENLVTVADQPVLGGVYKVANIYKNGLTHEEIMAMKHAVRSGLTDPKDIRDKVRDIMKLSSQAAKMTYPGELDVIRYLKEENGKLMFDGGTICSEWTRDPLAFSDPKDIFSGRLSENIMSVRRDNHILSKTFNKGTRAYRPLQPMFSQGQLTGDIETAQLAKARAQQRLGMLDAAHKRLLNPHEHIVGVEETLLQRQEAMARRLRQTGNTVLANEV